jgi:hypothetical protein
MPPPKVCAEPSQASALADTGRLALVMATIWPHRNSVDATSSNYRASEIFDRIGGAPTQVGMERVWNWTAQHNEVAMLFFVLIPRMLLKILTSLPI